MTGAASSALLVFLYFCLRLMYQIQLPDGGFKPCCLFILLSYMAIKQPPPHYHGGKRRTGLTLNWVGSTISISTREAEKPALICGGNINHFTIRKRELLICIFVFFSPPLLFFTTNDYTWLQISAHSHTEAGPRLGKYDMHWFHFYLSQGETPVLIVYIKYSETRANGLQIPSRLVALLENPQRNVALGFLSLFYFIIWEKFAYFHRYLFKNELAAPR